MVETEVKLTTSNIRSTTKKYYRKVDARDSDN